MTDWRQTQEGDSEIAAPAGEDSHETAEVHVDDSAETALDQPDDQVARTKNRTPPSNVVLLLGGILVLVIAQVVFSWLVFSATTQVRDQSAIANGLQRCILQAQLNQSTASDPNQTRRAIQSCLNK
jgi:hypothetical protein